MRIKAVWSFTLPALVMAQAPQQLNLDQLARFQGNKIILLGVWRPEEKKAMDAALNTEDVFDLGLTLIQAHELTSNTFGRVDPGAFEEWLRQHFELGNSRWVVLSRQNKALAFDAAIPTPEAMAALLAKSGLVSPIRELRTFLQRRPDHLEARADLIQQLRQRAMKLASRNPKGRLTPEMDTIVWAPLASAVDTTFKGDWRGIHLLNFRRGQVPPERNSPLMQAIFRRHIGKVEAALREVPTDEYLWNLWGWMARSLGDHPWRTFVDSLDPFLYKRGPTCPSPSIALWLMEEARAAGDWEHLVRMARVGLQFSGEPVDTPVQWYPSTPRITYLSEEKFTFDRLPLVEALLRLKRVDEAQEEVDNLLAMSAAPPLKALARIARTTGYPALAETWAKGTPHDARPRLGVDSIYSGWPVVGVSGWKDAPDPELDRIVGRAYLRKEFGLAMGWPKNEEHWALFNGRGRLLETGAGSPDYGEIQDLLTKHGLPTPMESARAYLQLHPGDLLASATYGFEKSCDVTNAMRKRFGAPPPSVLDEKNDQEMWADLVPIWRRIYQDDTIWKSPQRVGPFEFFPEPGWGAMFSPMMKALAGEVLPRIEQALEAQPRSDSLWKNWRYWRDIEGSARPLRPLKPLLDRLEPSPTTPPACFPPFEVLQTYKEECQRAGRWKEVVDCQRELWDRELARFDQAQRTDLDARPYSLVWGVGEDLAEALLHDGRGDEADAVVRAWTERAKSVPDLKKLRTLALSLGNTELAKTWSDMGEGGRRTSGAQGSPSPQDPGRTAPSW
jgi:hypothetical protein